MLHVISQNRGPAAGFKIYACKQMFKLWVEICSISLDWRYTMGSSLFVGDQCSWISLPMYLRHLTKKNYCSKLWYYIYIYIYIYIYGTLIYNGKSMVLWKKVWYYGKKYGTMEKVWYFGKKNYGTISKKHEASIYEEKYMVYYQNQWNFK